MQRKLLCDESIWSTLYEICTPIHIKGYDYDLTYCQFGNFKYVNCLNCPQNGLWKKANGVIEKACTNRWILTKAMQTIYLYERYSGNHSYYANFNRNVNEKRVLWLQTLAAIGYICPILFVPTLTINICYMNEML